LDQYKYDKDIEVNFPTSFGDECPVW
jgi:hypothetical protein